MMYAFKQDIAQTPEFAQANFSAEDVAAMRLAARENLTSVTSSAREPVCVLSAESISTFTIAELQDVRDFFSQHFESIDIVIYVRPLKERMESAFQEVLKTRFRSLNERFPLNYMRLAMNFDEVFGDKHVRFYRFSRDTFPRGSIVAHFLAQVGAPQPGSSGSTDNSRLSKEAVQLLYAYRKYFPHSRRGDMERLVMLSRHGHTAFHFHSSLYEELLHTGKNASRRFAKRTGFSVDQDVESHDNIGIRNEAELLDFSPESIAWLHQQLSWSRKLRFRKSHQPEKVAHAIYSLTAV